MLLYFDTDPDEIYLLDATTIGVAINKWSYIRNNIGADKFYHKCVFRHINFDRDDKTMDNLDIFLNEAEG